MTEEKYLYCPKCKKYPDNVIEECKRWLERFWDGECYEDSGNDYSTSENEKYFCAECDAILIDDADAKICDICKSPEDDDGRCGCTNKK